MICDFKWKKSSTWTKREEFCSVLVAILTVLFPEFSYCGVSIYSYDSLDRLRQIAYVDNTTVGYSYDPLGNRLQKGVYPDFPVSVASLANQFDTPEEMVYVLTSL